MAISYSIIEMAVQAKSDHNDGWTKKVYRKWLKEIKGLTKSKETKNFIEAILERENAVEYHI